MGAGRHKLRLLLGDRPVVAHVIDATLASQARPIILVLGHQADQVRARIALYTTHPDITIIENPMYLDGMSTSMYMGVQTLTSNGYKKSALSSHIDSALILLGDQPMITPRIIDNLITIYNATGKRIVAPLYARKRGSPVLFDASLFPELLEVTGDEGGRTVLEPHRQPLELVEMTTPLPTFYFT